MLSAKYGWVMIPRWMDGWMDELNHKTTCSLTGTHAIHWKDKDSIRWTVVRLDWQKVYEPDEMKTDRQEEFTSSQSFLWHHLALLTPELWSEAAIRWHEGSPSHLRRCLRQRLFVFHEQNRQQVKASGEIVSHFLLILKIWNIFVKPAIFIYSFTSTVLGLTNCDWNNAKQF